MKKVFALLMLVSLAVGFWPDEQRSIEGPFRSRPTPITSDNWIGGPEHDGRRVVIDLPEELRLRNKAGTNRAGLCVFTSLDMAGEWCDDPVFIGFRDYMTHYPGGGTPRKVDEYVAKKAAGRPALYLQDTSKDTALLDLAIKTRRMVGITYGFSPRYIDDKNPSGEIDHMVDLVYLDDKWGVVCDNNYPKSYEWMSRAELLRRWKLHNQGWLIVLLKPPPPIFPEN